MKRRNPFAVLLFSIITLGIYSIVWLVKTKGEMIRSGAKIPTAWLLIVPFVNIYWLWRYSVGVEMVTRRKTVAPIAFLLLFLLSLIGVMILQFEYNDSIPKSIVSDSVNKPNGSPRQENGNMKTSSNGRLKRTITPKIRLSVGTKKPPLIQ